MEFVENENDVADSVAAQQAKPVSRLRPLASVLEEVSSKGPLMERAALLESRLLQVSFFIVFIAYDLLT